MAWHRCGAISGIKQKKRFFWDKKTFDFVKKSVYNIVIINKWGESRGAERPCFFLPILAVWHLYFTGIRSRLKYGEQNTGFHYISYAGEKCVP